MEPSDSENRVGMDGIALWAGIRTTLPVLYLLGVGVRICFYMAQYLAMRRRAATAVYAGEGVWLCKEVSSPFVVGHACIGGIGVTGLPLTGMTKENWKNWPLLWKIWAYRCECLKPLAERKTIFLDSISVCRMRIKPLL